MTRGGLFDLRLFFKHPFGVKSCVLAAYLLLGLTLRVHLVGAEEALEKTTRKGPVEASVRLEPRQPRIGDPINLTLKVTAEKEVELIMPEFGQVMERFIIIDFVKNEKIDDQGRTVFSHRYELQAPRSGKQIIPPILVEFVDNRKGSRPAPEGLDSYELHTERLSFEVQSVLPSDVQVELNPPLGELSLLASSRAWVWAWVVGLLLLSAVALRGGRVWWLSRQKARRRSAYEIAMGRLTELMIRPHNEPQQMDAFFVELSAIVRWYLENRFELRAPELTTEEFLESMSRSPDLSGDHQAMLREFLHRADLVKFANFVPSEQDTDRSVEAARRFLLETHEENPETEPPVVSQSVGEVARV